MRSMNRLDVTKRIRPCRARLLAAFCCLLTLLSWVSPPLVAQRPGGVVQGDENAITGQVKDSTGAVLQGVQVALRLRSSGSQQTTHTDDEGRYWFYGPLRGEHELLFDTRGFAPVHREVNYPGGTVIEDVVLAPATLAQELIVSATQILTSPSAAERMPGSFEALSPAMLIGARVFTTEEALRKVAGINAREEEGLGLRPNIGIRGLNPTRSGQILLLEDGLPLAYAPYGDNASYYHPPIDRFESVEVVKGGGQILYGPRTIGAVINYLTPAPPQDTGGMVTLTGGSRDYINGHFRIGTTWRGTGMLFDYLHKQGQGARESIRSGLNDVNFKTLSSVTARQTLGFRLNYYTENSRVPYSGLRQAEWEANPRQNPFINDDFAIDRTGTSLRHGWTPRDSVLVSTAAYGTWFKRHWWRQSSNSNERPNDSADPACAGMAKLYTTCGNQGRLREFYTWGVESRARVAWNGGPLRNETSFGARLHYENQERLQKNGPLPASRDGVVVENNQRKAQAASFFIQNVFQLGKWAITPGVRVEHIDYDRLNRLGNAGTGVSGNTQLTVAVPGLGAAFNPDERFTFFTGVHRGFAPPRVEDVISNTTGASVELDPELSWNYELGMRARPARWAALELTFYRMDFENQIIPSSVAGGVGATLTNAGETLHQGVELAARLDWRRIAGTRHGLYWRTAYGWLPTAEFRGVRFSNIAGFTTVSITGNRLPYAPRHLLTSSVGYVRATGLDAMIEGVYTGSQFGDDLNTVAGTPDGQRGLIPGQAIFNLTLNYPVEVMRTTFFFTTKNLFDRLAIVDRARGLLPTAPRVVQAGLRWDF